MSNLNEATREIMWNISNAWVMYLLFFIAMGLFLFGLYKRICFWRQGKTDQEPLKDWGKRFSILVRELIFQKRVRGSIFPGFFHCFIFYSFAILVITTAIVGLDYDLGTSFFRGYLYVFFTVGADIGGLFILIGVAMAAYRRYVIKPGTISSGLDDRWALAALSLLVLTGFLIEGLRLAVKPDPWELLSPVGMAVSYLFRGISEESGKTAHVTIWWFHTALTMTWIALIPYTKFFHLLALPTNNFFTKLAPKGELKRVDMEKLMESDDPENMQVGVEKSSDMTWKQRMDFDACISCGRCDEACPSYFAKQPLSPQKFIANLKKLSHEDEKTGKPKDERVNLNTTFDDEFIWYCRTCTACVETCPASIEHVDLYFEARRNAIIMQGQAPGEAMRALKMIESQGNPFGAQAERVDWIRELGARIVGPGEKCEVLYWIGCCTTFTQTRHKIAADLFKIFKKCGIDAGVLGADEVCCGDPSRLLGQEMLFQQAAKQQVEALNSRKMKTLLVSCPHCYNVFKNEYPQFGGHYNVKHHTVFLQELIAEGRIKPKNKIQGRVTYHDPCYLGRYQGIYEQPRDAIESVPGLEMIDMERSRNKSYCCGGGGGHLWMDLPKGERINTIRIKQVMETKANSIVASCPYCMQMLDDSLKILNQDTNIGLMDIANLVWKSIE